MKRSKTIYALTDRKYRQLLMLILGASTTHLMLVACIITLYCPNMSENITLT